MFALFMVLMVMVASSFVLGMLVENKRAEWMKEEAAPRDKVVVVPIAPPPPVPTAKNGKAKNGVPGILPSVRREQNDGIPCGVPQKVVKD